MLFAWRTCVCLYARFGFRAEAEWALLVEKKKRLQVGSMRFVAVVVLVVLVVVEEGKQAVECWPCRWSTAEQFAVARETAAAAVAVAVDEGEEARV